MSKQPPGTGRTATVRAVLVRYPLARPDRLSLDSVARRCGLHPELVRRFVALGLVDASHDVTGEPWFAPDAPAVIARAERLHRGLSLNYAAIGVVLDLLDRIDALEAALRRAGAVRPEVDVPIGQARNDPPWT